MLLLNKLNKVYEEVFMKGLFYCSGIADESADKLDDQIKMHKQLGWDYIELRNINGKTIDTTDRDEFNKIKTALSENHIKVSCLASDVGKLHLGGDKYKPFEEDITSLNKLIVYAKELNCNYIRVMAYQQAQLSADEWRNEGVRRLQELAKTAEKNNIYLALENCVGWHAESGQRMAEFLDKVGSNNLVCLYDTGNPDAHHGFSAWDYYQAVKDRVAYIHVKDSCGLGKGFTYPGDGLSHVVNILEDQYKLGYKGFVSIEPHLAHSAHLPGLGGTEQTAWDTYKEYGSRLNALIQEIMK